MQYGGQQSSWQPSPQPAAHQSSQAYNAAAVHSYQQTGAQTAGPPTAAQQGHYKTSTDAPRHPSTSVTGCYDDDDDDDDDDETTDRLISELTHTTDTDTFAMPSASTDTDY